MSDKKPARNSWHVSDILTLTSPAAIAYSDQHTASQAVHNMFKLSRSRLQSTLARRNSMMPAADSGDTPTERNGRHLLNSSWRKPPTSDIERVDRLYSLVTATATKIAEILCTHDPKNKLLPKLRESADALLWLSDTRGGVFQGAGTISTFENAPGMFQLSKECLFELGKLITCGMHQQDSVLESNSNEYPRSDEIPEEIWRIAGRHEN